MKLKIILLFSFYFIIVNSYSQNPIFENFTTDNGLASDFVYHVFEDSKGAIWCGTNNGVSYYDGKTFTNYTMNDGLSDKEILKIFEDKLGRIWFFCFNGKVCFFKNNKFYNDTNTPWLGKFNSNNRMLDYYIGNKKELYFLNKFHVLKLDSNSNIKEILTSQNDSTNFYSFYPKNNKTFIISNNQLIDIENIKNIENLNFNIPYVNKVYRIENEYYLTNGISIYTKNKQQQLELFYKFDNSFKNVLQGLGQNNEYLYIGSTDGVFQISKKNKTIKHFYRGFSATNIIVDFQGGLWIGSTNKGIIHIPTEEIKIITTTQPFNLINIEHINNQLFIFDSKGDIFEITNDSIIPKYLIKGNSIRQIYSIKKTQPNSYYFCELGILDYNLTNQLFQKYRSGFSIKDVLINNDDVYLASSLGIIKTSIYNLKNNLYKDFINGKLKKIESDYTRFLFNYKDKIIAVGIYGIKIIEKDIPIEIENKNKLLHNQANDAKLDNNGNLWIASNGMGIAKLNLQNNTVQEYTNISDLLNCQRICFENNSIWALGNTGIYKFNKQINNFELFISKSAFLNDKIVDFTFKDSISLIALSKKNVYTVPLNYTKLNSIPKQIEFTSISFNDNIIKDTIIDVVQQSENVLRFNYKSISYNYNNDLIYKYILRGVDRKEYFTKNNEIRYTSLPAGEYTFEISACIDENTNLFCPVTKLKIYIHAPWYKSLWFKILIISLIIIFISSIILIRYNQLKLKHDLIKNKIETEKNNALFKKDLIQLEQKALLAQMNPHFIFNSLNTIQNYYLLGETDLATTYLSKFSHLLRRILEASDTEFISLIKEKELMTNYADLYNLKLERKFIFEFIIDEELDPYETLIPTMIIQPFLENALLHGITNHSKTGKISITIEKVIENCLNIRVTDNGVGRNSNNKKNQHEGYESKGLTITQKRITHLNEYDKINSEIRFLDLKNEDGSSAGTSVLFNLVCKYINS